MQEVSSASEGVLLPRSLFCTQHTHTHNTHTTFNTTERLRARKLRFVVKMCSFVEHKDCLRKDIFKNTKCDCKAGQYCLFVLRKRYKLLTHGTFQCYYEGEDTAKRCSLPCTHPVPDEHGFIGVLVGARATCHVLNTIKSPRGHLWWREHEEG